MASISEVLYPIIDHPKLSTSFKGLRHSISSPEQPVWQFRGIKYGNVSARFQQSTLNEAFSPSVYDATTYGPKSPQTHFPLRIEDGLIALPPGIATHSEDIFDEFNCLNLNITAPAGANERSSLPVLIYIHGGGGFSGSNGDWWCDGGSIVKRSLEIGRPVIAIAINYRISALGYIGSDELGTEYGKENNGNQGLRDTHLAINWVHRNIAPFGGSSHNLTIYGESHGAVIVDLLLRTSLPLPIARAITQSGQSNTTISTPKSLAELDALYTGLKQYLNISALSELQAVPYTDLLDAYTKTDPAAGLRPSFLVDGYFFTEDWRESSFKGPVMIGNTGAEDCVLESYCALYPRQTPPPTLSTLVATLTPILGAPTLNSILTAYSISEKMEKGEMLDKFLKVVADVMLIKPAYDHALQWRKQGNEVQQYTFEQKQPFGGIYRGKAAHSLDMAYLHGKPEIFSGTTDPEGEIKMQRAMQDAWVRFAHGEEGWGKSGLVRRFGPGEVVDESVETLAKKWIRGDAWKSLEGLNAEQVDALVGLCSGFIGGFIGFETTA